MDKRLSAVRTVLWALLVATCALGAALANFPW